METEPSVQETWKLESGILETWKQNQVFMKHENRIKCSGNMETESSVQETYKQGLNILKDIEEKCTRL